MSEESKYFDLDMARMDEEAVLILAAECEFQPARDELILRYAEQRDLLVGWLSRSTELTATDVEDARQNAVFWTVEAIQKYDTDQMLRPRGCSFRSFHQRVVTARFKDFLKHVRRRKRHHESSVAAQGEYLTAAGADAHRVDPAEIAVRRESLGRLRQAIAELEHEQFRMWTLLSEGNSLREISHEMGVSYDSTKRRRRKLISQLKSRLTVRAPN